MNQPELEALVVELSDALVEKQNQIDRWHKAIGVFVELAQTDRALSLLAGDYSMDSASKMGAIARDSSKLKGTFPHLWRLMDFGAVNMLNGAFHGHVAEGKRNRSHDLYVMKSVAMGSTKVGRTKAGADVRLAQLRGACPDIELVCVFKGQGHMETRVHRALRHLQVGGEWFSIDTDRVQKLILDLIEKEKAQ